MRIDRRRTMFPTDLGLLARMAVAIVLTPLVVLAALAALVAFAPVRVTAVVFGAALLGTIGAVKERRGRAPARELTAEEAPELHAKVERLCLLADLPKPAIVVEQRREPNSWIVAAGAGRARLHLTSGLLELLDAHELDAVIAHELSHVANHDALVMTVVGGPASVLLGGGARLGRHGGWWPLMIGGMVAAGIGWLGSVGSRATASSPRTPAPSR